MTNEEKRPFAQWWNEFWGRKSVMDPIPFNEVSVLTQPARFKVGFVGYFLHLPPNTAAIIRSAKDQAFVFTEGGYVDLKEGAYTLQYVDTSNRFFTFPAISAPALDSTEVSLTVSIFYKINDPEAIKNNPTPLKALFSICEGAIRNFIVTHRYDELIGEQDNEHFISDYFILQHIKEQVALKEACRAFWLKDVIIEERRGSYELTRLKQERTAQKSQSQIEKEGVVQQRGIAEERKELERTKAEQAIMVKEMQAAFEANKIEIMGQARRLEIELELMRKQPEMQQARYMKLLDTKQQTVESLLQLFKISGFPRDEDDLKLIDRILTSLSDTQPFPPELPSESTKNMRDMNSTIINLIVPKK